MDEVSSCILHPGTGWRSVSQMRQEGKGAPDFLKNELEKLQETLVFEAIGSGLSDSDARAFVEENQVGIRKSAQGGPATLYASPEVWERLFDELPPPAPANWKSYCQLVKLGYRGGVGAIRNRLEFARSEFIENIAASGYDKAEATALVDAHLISRRRPSKGTGASAVYASTDAVAILERDGLLKKRKDHNNFNTQMLESDPLASRLLAVTRQLEQRGDGASARKFYQLIACEFPDTKEADQARMALSENLTQQGFER